MSMVEDLVVEMLGDTKDIVGVLCPVVKFIENWKMKEFNFYF